MSKLDHLKELFPIQCSGCLMCQLWEGDGDPGKYVFYLVESHAEGCPHFDRNGTKVWHSEFKWESV